MLEALGPRDHCRQAAVASGISGGSQSAVRPGALRGLYSGGTLADEAMVVAGAVLGDIRSNIPLRPEPGAAGGAARAPVVRC